MTLKNNKKTMDISIDFIVFRVAEMNSDIPDQCKFKFSQERVKNKM
jgi:hypothetical protein